MKPGLEPANRPGLCRLGLEAGLQALASPGPQKPVPSPGFQAQPGPHITNPRYWPKEARPDKCEAAGE